MSLYELLYRFNLIHPTHKHITKLQSKNQLNKLLFLHLHGNYKARMNSAIAFGNLKAKEAIPVLMNSLNDKVFAVVENSANALLKIGVDENTKQQIENDLKIAKDKDCKLKKALSKRPTFSVDIPKWDKVN